MGNTNRFVWHDLNTRDVEGAKSFYGELFNWKFEKSDGPYQHIKAGEEMIGGIRTMDANEPGPSNWLGYVHCDNVEATVSRITENGGRVYVATKVMEGVGTFAVVADPTGAVFAPWKSARPNEDVEAPQTAMPTNHTFCWDELMTQDTRAAAAFYSKVYGWEPQEVDMGPGGIYTLLNRPGTTNNEGKPRGAGGIFKAPEMVKHAAWVAYVAVPDADATIAKAQKFGAKIDMPPTDIPNIGRFAAFEDSVGAHLAILAPPKK